MVERYVYETDKLTDNSLSNKAFTIYKTGQKKAKTSGLRLCNKNINFNYAIYLVEAQC